MPKAPLGPLQIWRALARHYVELEKPNLIVIFPLLLLALFSIFFGFVFSDLFVGMGSDFFQNSIFMHPKNISLIEAEFSLTCLGCPTDSDGFLRSNNIFIKLLPAILSFTGAFSAIVLYHLPRLSEGFFLINTQAISPPRKRGSKRLPLLYSALPRLRGRGSLPKAQGRHYVGSLQRIGTRPKGLGMVTNNKIGRNIYAFLNGKYYFDVIYNHFIIQSGLKLGYNISKEIDRGAIEFLGPYGLSNYFYNAIKLFL